MIMMADKKKVMTSILGEHPESKEKSEMESHEEMLQSLGEELGECIESKDWSGVVSTMRALFQAFDAAPHQEGPHLK